MCLLLFKETTRSNPNLLTGLGHYIWPSLASKQSWASALVDSKFALQGYVQETNILGLTFPVPVL